MVGRRGPLRTGRSALHRAGTAENFAGQGAGCLSGSDDWHTIYQYPAHSFAQLVGLGESRQITNLSRIKDDDIGPHAGLEHSPVGERRAASPPSPPSSMRPGFICGFAESEGFTHTGRAEKARNCAPNSMPP